MTQRRTRRRPAPSAEPLEEKLLRASVHLGHGAFPGRSIVLTGEVSGFEQSTRPAARGTVEVVNPLAGTAGVLGGTVALLDERENAAGAALSGTVVLRNARGSVRLAFAAADILVNYDPHHNDGLVARYRVVGGSGAFAHAAGAGELSIKRDSGPVFHLAIQSTTA